MNKFLVALGMIRILWKGYSKKKKKNHRLLTAHNIPYSKSLIPVGLSE